MTIAGGAEYFWAMQPPEPAAEHSGGERRYGAILHPTRFGYYMSSKPTRRHCVSPDVRSRRDGRQGAQPSLDLRLVGVWRAVQRQLAIIECLCCIARLPVELGHGLINLPLVAAGHGRREQILVNRGLRLAGLRVHRGQADPQVE